MIAVKQALLSGDGRNELSAKCKMMGCCTRKYPQLDQTVHVLEWFTEQRSQAPFIRRKVVPGKRVTLLSEVPWASQLFLHFHAKLDEPFNKKQKVGSARGVTRLAGSPSFDGRVTLLAGPNFLHMSTLARPAGSTRPRRDDQSMRGHCCY